MVYDFLSRLVESRYCRYTSLVVRQDIDANTFVGAKPNIFWRHFFTANSKLMQNTSGFLFFLSFVASGTKNTYVECTRDLVYCLVGA